MTDMDVDKIPKSEQLNVNFNGNSFNFHKFNIRERMEHIKNMAAAIYSKRRTGKSVLLRDLMFQIKDWYSDIHCFFGTADVQSDIYDFVPKDQVYDGFVPEKLEEIWNQQREYISEQVRNRPDKSVSESEYKKTLDYVMLIFDDIIDDPRIRQSKLFQEIFTKGRHLNFAIFVLSQEMGGKGGLSKKTRANLDLAIAFFLNGEYDRDLFTSQYISTIDKKTGIEIFKGITSIENSYNAIIVNNHITSPNPESYIDWYRSSLDIPSFKVGENIKEKKRLLDLKLNYRSSEEPLGDKLAIQFKGRVEKLNKIKNKFTDLSTLHINFAN